MMQKRARQIEKIITGVLQLCRVESDRIVWVDQLDAAAFSDGEKIYLPRPTGEHDGEFDLLLALALREIARIMHSEAGRFAEPGSDAGMAVILEDVRVKKAIEHEYRGSPEIFHKAYSFSESLLDGQSGEASVEEVKHRLVYLAANDALHGCEYRHKLGPDFFQAVTGLPDGVRCEVMDIASKACDATSTLEAFDLANQLHELLARQPQDQDQHQDGQPQGEDDQQSQAQEQQQDGQPQGEDDQQPQAQEQQQDGQPQGEDDQQPQTQEQQQDGQPQGEADQQPQDQEQQQDSQPQGEDDQQSHAQEQQQDGQPQGEDDQTQGEAASGTDYISNALARLRGFDKAARIAGPPSAVQVTEPLADEELEAIQELLDGNVAGDVVLDRFALVADEADDEEQDAADEVWSELVGLDAGSETGSQHLEEEQNLGSNLLPQVPGRLVSVLLRELQDRRRRPSKLAYSGSRVDASRVWRIKSMGDAKVFRKKAKVHGIDAGVSILLDRSGSMDDDIEQATSVTYAMAIALQRVSGVKASIDVFPGLAEPVREVLAFRQNPRLIKSELESIIAMGGTPTADALSFRLQKLIELKCEKRLVFVITDGKPDSPGDLAQVLRRAAREDISVIGVGIGRASAVRTHFPASVTVDSVNELPEALEDLFRNTLVDRLAA